MASGIFAILDDIALLADDVAISAKLATKKTAAILGDDLAVNAQKATGFEQHRELKVIWQITKGSILNKIIILPFAFLLSMFAPWIVPYILIIAGLYLLYEGAEKIIHTFSKHKDEVHEKALLESTNETVLEVEKTKVKAAIRTDFILSIEIIFLALGSVLDKPLLVQIVATSFVALLATIGVYGLVALIVRLDNVGFWCIEKQKEKCGNFLVSLMPKIIKTLGVIGTIAMLLVGGGILVHNIEFIHHLLLDSIPAILQELIIGFIIGSVIVVLIKSFAQAKKAFSKA